MDSTYLVEWVKYIRLPVVLEKRMGITVRILGPTEFTVQYTYCVSRSTIPWAQPMVSAQRALIHKHAKISVSLSAKK